jgi:hypothetical protein
MLAIFRVSYLLEYICLLIVDPSTPSFQRVLSVCWVTAGQWLNPRPSLRIWIEAKPLE